MNILYNACIHTLDPTSPTATALAIDDGLILAVGTDLTILSEFESQADAQDMHGRPIIPGLTDAHIHLQNYAIGLEKVDCSASRNGLNTHPQASGSWAMAGIRTNGKQAMVLPPI